MTSGSKCPSQNHRRTDAPLHFCPACGEDLDGSAEDPESEPEETAAEPGDPESGLPFDDDITYEPEPAPAPQPPASPEPLAQQGDPG